VGIGEADDLDAATRYSSGLAFRLSCPPAESYIETSAATTVGYGEEGSMGIIEILLLVALMLYLFGDEIGQRSYPRGL
jgi:hypothetical protein